MSTTQDTAPESPHPQPDTSRTDEYTFSAWDGDRPIVAVPVFYARQLERELNEARAQVAALMEYAQATEYWKIEPFDAKERQAFFKRFGKLVPAKPKSPWILVTERLPTREDGNNEGEVLWLNFSNLARIGSWRAMFAYRTHWCRIPKLPEA